MVLPPSPTLSLCAGWECWGLGFPTPQPLMDAVPHPPRQPTRASHGAEARRSPWLTAGMASWPGWRPAVAKTDGRGSGGATRTRRGSHALCRSGMASREPEPAGMNQSSPLPPAVACLLLPPQEREPTQSTPVQPATVPSRKATQWPRAAAPATVPPRRRAGWPLSGLWTSASPRHGAGGTVVGGSRRERRCGWWGGQTVATPGKEPTPGRRNQQQRGRRTPPPRSRPLTPLTSKQCAPAPRATHGCAPRSSGSVSIYCSSRNTLNTGHLMVSSVLYRTRRYPAVRCLSLPRDTNAARYQRVTPRTMMPSTTVPVSGSPKKSVSICCMSARRAPFQQRSNRKQCPARCT